MKYIIQKEIEAKDIKEALENEAKGKIIYIDEKKEDIIRNNIGFECK